MDVGKVVKSIEEAIQHFSRYSGDEYGREYDYARVGVDVLEDAIALLKAQEPITGETSDGYHTFNELYHHRAVLFSVIVANYKDRAWKSVRHHDGTMYDGMFIVGIDTPDGQATYHYDINPYWDMFDCKVREFAPKWDGHTPEQAIERIGKLKAQEPRTETQGRWERVGSDGIVCCSECGMPMKKTRVCFPDGGSDYYYIATKYCPHCGAKNGKGDCDG